MIKRLLIVILIIQLSIPAYAQQSFFDDGDKKVEVKLGEPASAPIFVPQVKLEPTPETDVPPQAAPPLSIEAFEKPASSADIQSTLPFKAEIVSTRTPEGKGKYCTGFIINAGDGYQYVITSSSILKFGNNFSFGAFHGGKLFNSDKDLAVLQFGENVGVGVDISQDDVKINDCLYSVGGGGIHPIGRHQITISDHVVKRVTKSLIYIDSQGLAANERVGAPVFTEEGLLVGVFTGKSKEGLLILTKAAQIEGLLNKTVMSAAAPTTHTVFYFTAKWCGPCRQVSPNVDLINKEGGNIQKVDVDLRPDLMNKYGITSIPAFVVEQDGKITVRRVGYMSYAELKGLQPVAAPKEEMKPFGFKWRGQQKQEQKPSAAIDCATQVDQLYGWYNDYLKGEATGSVIWNRSGERTFNLYGGEKSTISLERLCGKTGSFEFHVNYPSQTDEKDKLPVQDLKFAYNINGEDIDFTVDSVKVHSVGLAKMVNDKFSQNEQAKGFIGVLTLFSILSTVHTLYVLFHPVADLELGGEFAASTQMVGDEVLVNFVQGKQPTVKVKSVMNFSLPINQVIINRQTKKIVAKFSGTMLAKQYTLNIK